MHELTRALIFDADGVLIRPWGFADALEALHGITRSMTQPFFQGPFCDCLIGKQDLRTVLPPYLREWGWSGSTNDFIRLWMQADDQPADDVLVAIEAMQHPTDLLCIASNQERIRARYIADEMGFASRFRRRYFSCDLGCMKPCEAYYVAVQRDLGIRGEQIFFWDDSPPHVAAAAALGWNACVFEGARSVADGLARS